MILMKVFMAYHGIGYEYLSDIQRMDYTFININRLLHG